MGERWRGVEGMKEERKGKDKESEGWEGKGEEGIREIGK